MRMRFEDFEVDLETGELSRAGRRLRLADKPFRILEALLERPGEMVTRETLRERLWPGATFVNFDNNLNTAVNKLRETLSDSAETPRFIETIPKRGYRFNTTVQAVEERRARSSWQAKAVGIAAAMALAGSSVFWLFSGPGNAQTDKTRLVVLPFENLSGDPNRDFVTDGLTEELIGRLARLDPQTLGVIARTSSMQYKGAARNISEIARELSVDYLVEGSVRHQGQRVRVSAQLIAAADQTHVWAEVYEGDATDLFAIQEEVSERIAEALGVELVPGPVVHVAVPEAYEIYLKARYLASQGTLGDLEKSVELFERVIEIDADYVPAWVGLADAYRLMPLPPDERFPKTKQAALKALELDPASAEAHLWLAVVQYYYDWEWDEARKSFERALELAPGSAVVHHEYASYLASLGRHEESLAAIARAKELDPVSVAVSADFGWYFYIARRYEDAIAACLEALELEPEHDDARTYLVLSHFANGNPGEALAVAQSAADEKIHTLEAYWRWRIAFLNEHRASGVYVSPTAIARYQVALGDTARAHELLELAFEEHAGSLVFLGVYPLFDALRTDARFQELERHIGIPDAREVAVSAVSH